MCKQAGLPVVQRMHPPAAFLQTDMFVLFAPFFNSQVHKARKVVQATLYKMTVVVLPAPYQGMLQVGNHVNDTRSVV